ncbi:type II toxin-antitoxin system RelE/ParE family toxin [Lichenicoccus sp.]|uniref:type II toxin-antitoxin system RelE/ParE family toxin n=1 Tax=Lichenicoccus sp. TaxID=2781899 RepID=UPI003D11917B
MSRYTLSGPALQDITMILAESAARFGDAASERYERLIATALIELAADPAQPGSRAAPELADGARIYHLRDSKRRARAGAGAVGAPRHFVLYRVLEPDLIGIARVLHDSMDLPAHATDDFGEG